MEKNKKVVKNYVVCYGGSRGEFDEVEGVESDLSIEEYLIDLGEDNIKVMLESCRDEEERDDMREWFKDFKVGFVSKYESSKGFEVYGLCLGEESSVLMFEGKEEDVEEELDLFDYLGI